MVYFFEMIARLFAFDIGWYASQIMANLFWIFVVTAVMYIFLNGKRVLFGVILFFVVAHVWAAAEQLYGVAIFAAGFLGIYYMTKLATMAFAESVPSLKNHLILITTVQFYVLFLAYNIFLR